MCNLNIKIYGKGKKILFIHGWNHSHAIWSRTTPYFTKENEFECILIDLPGFGESSKVRPQNITLNAFNNLITQSLNNTFSNLKIHAIVSDSLGALLTLKLLENGFKAEKTILCGCPINGLDGLLNILKIKKVIRNSLSFVKKLPPTISKPLIKLFSDYTVWDNKNISDDIISGVLKSDPLIAELIFKEIAEPKEFDFNKIKRNTSEILVLRGIKDNVVSYEDGVYLADKLDSKLIEIPNSGHTPQQENPKAFYDEIISFLDRGE